MEKKILVSTYRQIIGHIDESFVNELTKTIDRFLMHQDRIAKISAKSLVTYFLFIGMEPATSKCPHDDLNTIMDSRVIIPFRFPGATRGDVTCIRNDDLYLIENINFYEDTCFDGPIACYSRDVIEAVKPFIGSYIKFERTVV